MAVPLEQFVKHLEESGILAGDTLKDFIPPKASPKDAEELLRELMRQKKLTKFQAEQVWHWKGHCDVTSISDFSPLKGMPLEQLQCGFTQVSDFSPLKELPLRRLQLDFKPERDTEILRSIKTLETINNNLAAEFWKEVAELSK